MNAERKAVWKRTVSQIRALGLLVALGLVVALASLTMGGDRAQAAQIGDDGLHKASWMRDTFKDLREDLEEANAS